MEVGGADVRPHDEGPPSGLNIYGPEHDPLRVPPADWHLGRYPPLKPARPEHREEVQLGLVLEQLGAARWQIPDLLPDQPQSPAHPRRFRAPEIQPRSLPDVIQPVQFPADLEVGRSLPPLPLNVLAQEWNRPVHGQVA